MVPEAGSVSRNTMDVRTCLKTGEEGVLGLGALLQSGANEVAGTLDLSTFQLTEGAGLLGLLSEVFLVRLGVVLLFLDLLLGGRCVGGGGSRSIGVRGGSLLVGVNGTFNFSGQLGLALISSPSGGDSLLRIGQSVSGLSAVRLSVGGVTTGNGGRTSASGSSGGSATSSFTVSSGSVSSGS